jgi:WD40 repeat protein
MKRPGSTSIILLVLALVGCVSQSRIVPTVTLPTQPTMPVFTATPNITLAESISISSSPTIIPKLESLTQLSSLSLPEFNARYSTGDISLNQDGKFMAVVSKNRSNGDNSIWIWNVNDLNESLAGYPIVAENLWSVAFSLNGNQLAIGGTEIIVILDWKTGDILDTIELPGVWVVQLAYGSNDTLVSSGSDDKVIVWDLLRREIKYSVDGITGFEDNSFAISPNGKTLVTGAYTGIQLWDFESGQSLGFHDEPSGGIGIAPVSVFSGTGSFLASTGCSEFVFEGCSRGKIIMWRADSSTPSIISEVHPSWIRDLAFSPDEGTLASISGEGIINLMNLGDEKITRVPSVELPGKLPPGNPFLMADVDFLSDGRVLAVSTSDGIQLLDIASMSWLPNLRFILSLGYPYTITSEGDNLNFRIEPSMNGEMIKKLRAGDWFGIIDGPKIVDGYVWWKVKIADDTEGWIVEMPAWYEFNP